MANAQLRQRLASELAWTLAAVGLTIVVGGSILALVSLWGGAWWLDDFQSYFMPGYCEINRALGEGSFPLLSLSSWFGGDLAGEYQYGVFSVAHLAIVLVAFQGNLGLSGTVALLIGAYTAILAAGAFRLARSYGLTVPNAIIACLAAALNGWMIYWGARTWFPALTSFAWLPWVWWGLQLAMDNRRGTWRFVPAGVFLYLLVAAGWPFTVLMAGLVTVWLLARNCHLFRRGQLWPPLAAWALGLALASPAILALLEYHSFTARAETWSTIDSKWAVPAEAFGGAIVPQMPASWFAFEGDFQTDRRPDGSRNSCEMFCGLVPCVALLAAMVTGRRRFAGQYRWELGLAAAVAVLCCWGSLGAFRWSFRWLPLLHLLLGLLGGLAVEQWPSLVNPDRPLESHPRWSACLGGWSCMCVGTILVYVWLMSVAVDVYFIGVGLSLLALSLAWLLGERWLPANSGARGWLPVGVMGVALVVGSVRPVDAVPHWSIGEAIREPGPFDKARTYLAVLSLRDIYANGDGTGEINRFANTAMYAGLRFVNGYTPMIPRQLGKLLATEWIGQMSPRDGRFLKTAAPSGGLLSQMGVDGLVLGPDFMPYADLVRQSGWELVGRFPMGMVFHRPGPPDARVRPVAEAVPSERAVIREIDESRLSVRCQLENLGKEHDAMLVFSRAYYPGYRAYLNGTEIPVETFRGVQPAVRLPAGVKGELRLAFWPSSVRWGIAIAVAACAVTLVLLAANVFRRRMPAPSR